MPGLERSADGGMVAARAGGGDVFVAAAAGVFGDPVIELGDLDGVGIPASREVERMPETVVGLHRICAEDVVGRVAIVTGGGGVVARFQPGIVLGTHHMAIGAGGGIVGEVRIA